MTYAKILKKKTILKDDLLEFQSIKQSIFNTQQKNTTHPTKNVAGIL